MLSLVLVAPQMGENIGAVARAMGNFGLSDLRIVAPRDGWPNPAATAMAAHAKPIIENAKLFDDVESAIADCHYVVAATARQREMPKPHLTTKEWVRKDIEGHTALLLGRENNGLTNEEIALAHAIVSVPVHADCPSINLAQSAAILCYEWFQHQNPISQETSTEATARQAEINSLFKTLESELDAVNFWNVPEKKAKMWRNLRSYFLRGAPSSQEVQSLHGMVKALVLKHKH